MLTDPGYKFCPKCGARVVVTGPLTAPVAVVEPDAPVLSWAAKEIRKQCRPDETPVIIMASDGAGSLQGEAYWRGQSQVSSYVETPGPDRVAQARKAGIKVLSVAIGGLDPVAQQMVYGQGNFLAWRGSIQAMAKPLGDLLARIASSHMR